MPPMRGDQLHQVGPSNTTMSGSSPIARSERTRPPCSIHSRQRSSLSSGTGSCGPSGTYPVSWTTDPAGWPACTAAKCRSQASVARGRLRHCRPVARRVSQRGCASWRSSRTSPSCPTLRAYASLRNVASVAPFDLRRQSAPLECGHAYLTGDAFEVGRTRWGHCIAVAQPRSQPLAHHDLVTQCQARNPRGEVHATTSVPAVAARGQCTVEPNPNARRKAMRSTVFRQRPLNVDGATRSLVPLVKCDEEAVAGIVDLLTMIQDKGFAQGAIVPLNEDMPGVVANGSSKLRGSHDVSEHEGSFSCLRSLP